MRKRLILLPCLALTLLIACGEKQPPAAPTGPGGGLDGGLGGLDGGGLEPLDGGGGGFEPIDGGGGFNPDDGFDGGGFVDQPPPVDPGTLPPDPAPSAVPSEPPVDPSAEPSGEPGTEPSAEPSADPEPTPEPTPEGPAAPTGLASDTITASTFNLSWTAVPDATGYKILLDDVEQSTNYQATSFSFSGLTPDTEYQVAVVAQLPDGDSPASEPLSVTTSAIGAPEGLTFADLEATSFTLSWDATDDALSYSVYQDGALVATDLTTTSYAVTGLSEETSYFYEVTATTAAGESAKSSSLDITTPKAPDPFGNEKLGFLNTSAMTDPNGLDVKNGHAYIGYYFFDDGFFSDTNERRLRDLNIATGQTTNTEISEGNPGSNRVKISGVAVNAAVIWLGLDAYDDDGYNLYKYNVNGSQIGRYKVSDSGTIISDVAVAASSGRLFIGSRTTQSIIRYNELDENDTQLLFSGEVRIDPLGLATDDSGHVYTFDGISRKIIKYNGSDGSRMLEFGPTGVNGTGETYTAVSDVAVDPRNGEIYVVGNAAGTIKIFRYDANGNFIRSFSNPDLVDPRKLKVDADGKVYVVDATKKGVLVFSPGIVPST